MTPDHLPPRLLITAAAGWVRSFAMERYFYAVLLAGALHATCVAPQGAPPRPPGAIHATEEEPTYLHLDTMDPAIVAAIRAGIEIGRERFGTYGHLRVYVMNGRDDNRDLVEDFCARSYRASSGGTTEEQVAGCVESFELPEEEGRIYSSIHHHSIQPFGAIVFINFNPPTGEGPIPHEAKATAVHEYVHIYQAAFQEPGGPDPNNPQQQIPGPAWLTEGAATYMAIASADDQVWIERAHERCESLFRNAVEKQGVFLDDGETYDTLEGPELVHAVLYQGGASAVKWLIDSHSPEAFWEGYYTAIPELGWEGAFEQAFGMTIDSFYGAFRDHLEP